MVESEANEMTEDEMLGGVLFGHQEMQAIIKAVAELAAEAGKEAWDWQAAAPSSCRGACRTWTSTGSTGAGDG